MELDQLNDALQALGRAEVLDARHWKVLINLGICLYRSGREVEAIGKIEEAVRINPDSSEAWYHKAIAEASIERYPDAKESIRHSLASDESNANAWALRGAMEWWDSRDCPAATTSLRRALELDPQDLGAQRTLREIRAETPQSVGGIASVELFLTDGSSRNIGEHAAPFLDVPLASVLRRADAELDLRGALSAHARDHEIPVERAPHMEPEEWTTFLHHRHRGRPWRRWFGRKGPRTYSVVVVSDQDPFENLSKE